jgi:hypothetical protein
MNELLQHDLVRMKRRIRLLLIERHAFMVGTAAALAAAIMVILSHWWYSLGEPSFLTGLIVIGLLGGLVWGVARKLTPFAVARAAETRLELKERLSSAVLLSPSEDDVVRAIVEDAQTHLKDISAKEVFPHKLTREMGAFAVAVMLLLGIFFMPQMPAFQSKTRQQEVKVMNKQGQELRALAKQAVKAAAPENKEIMKRVALNMDRLGKKLESGRLTRKQAMLAVNKLTKDIKDAQDKMAAKTASKKSVADASNELKSASSDLAKKMLDRVEAEQKANKAAGKKDPKLDKLAQKLKDMQSKSGQLSDTDINKLDQEYSSYLSSQSGLNMPPGLSQLMAQLLQNQDYKKAMELMSKLSKKLGSGQMSKMDQQQLQDQLDALAKALKGTNLNELAKKLREAAEALAKMDPKEAAKLMAQAQNMMPMDMAMLGKMGGT